MIEKPTYEELEKKVKDFEKKIHLYENDSRDDILRIFSENIDQAFYIMPSNYSKIIYTNSAAKRLYGISVDEAYENPMSWMKYIYPEDLEKITSNLQEQNNGTIQGYQTTEFRVNHPERGEIWIKSTIYPTKTKPDYLVGISTDITKDKQAEKEKKKFEAELRQAHKMESIGILAGGIAHDFNNLLIPILGYTEMLLEDFPENSLTRDRLNRIFDGVLRAKDLVKQILTFSRQENCELKRMKIQPILKEVLKLIRSSIPTTIKFKQDIRNDCGTIKADPTQIHQIIINLVINAYHAMENTIGELRIGLKEIKLDQQNVVSLEPGIYACLTVADTGIGMDKDLIGKIFDPFFTTKEQGKGTGMGLSVVHGIVKNMDGTIQVYSEPGKGTVFYVYLPVDKSFSGKQILPAKESILR